MVATPKTISSDELLRHTVPSPERVASPAPAITLSESDLAEAARLDPHAVSSGTVDVSKLFARKMGRAGLPWVGGRLYLETHKDLQCAPFAGVPGKLWDLANDPLVEGMLARVDALLTTTTYITHPVKLPTHLKDNKRAAHAASIQYQFCERLLWEFQRRGQGSNSFNGWLRSNLWTTPKTGWSWYELTGTHRTIQLDGESEPRHVLWFDVPRWRAPWSLQYVLQQREEFRGLIASFSGSTDYTGSTGEYFCVIPAEKILTVSTRRIGSNIFGKSWVRAPMNFIEGKRTGYRTELVEQEVNGVGEPWAVLGENTSYDSQAAKDVGNYMLDRTAVGPQGCVLPPGSSVYFKQPSTKNLESLHRRSNEEIAHSFGQTDLLVALSGTGAYNARELASNEARAAMSAVVNELIAEPLEELFARALEINFPEFVEEGLVFVPHVSWEGADTASPAEEIELIGKGVEAGVLNPTRADEAILREKIGMTPLPPEEEEDPASPTRTYTSDEIQQISLMYERDMFAHPVYGPYFEQVFGLPAADRSNTPTLQDSSQNVEDEPPAETPPP